ncbi:MAG: LrgB family protein [Ruminococcaceae bacterium]|nr:LrgB family protein [Oscillospiraceae bacterium]
MEAILDLSMLPLFVSILVYLFGIFVQNKVKSPLCNPLLITIIIIICALLLTGYPNANYQASMKSISWLITPTTICMAVPLYEQLQVLRKDWKAILAGISAGTVASLFYILIMCRVLHFDAVLSASLLPKSITTAMGTALCAQTGGNEAITTAAIVITGILGNIISTPLCKLLRIKHPIAQGVALGTSAHVMGTAKARELSDLTGAVSSLSLTFAGILTAVLYPLIMLI